MKVGVTGGIGSGKSEVCAIFQRLGVPVLYADQISKEISTTDAAVRRQIRTLLGPEAYGQDGSLNRPKVAELIFSKKALQTKLEAILHPRVRDELENRAKSLGKDGNRLVVIEAALMYEAGYDRWLDAVIVVDADESSRLQRVRKRDAVSEADVRSRMKAQMEPSAKLGKADYVIMNDGTLPDLDAKVRFLHSLFLRIN
ncbi:MAG: dephospho-CoA kinase [Bacteroidota bacterium]